MLTSFVVLGAADAGRVDEDGSGMVLTAAELLAPDRGHLSGCRIVPLSQEPADTMAVNTSRMERFDWNATTGELSFTAAARTAALTLPEDFVKVASDQSIQDCGPR